MRHQTVAMFGEAEKGQFQTAYFCQTLAELENNLGNPPQESLGLHLAIQTLLFKKKLLFFRVEEEGFSNQDYLHGLSLLEQHQFLAEIGAIGLPGVGDKKIIEATNAICNEYNVLILTTESDLYDYLTSVLTTEE